MLVRPSVVQLVLMLLMLALLLVVTGLLDDIEKNKFRVPDTASHGTPASPFRRFAERMSPS